MALAGALWPPQAFAAGESTKRCDFEFVPVSIAPGEPATSRVATWLCYKGSPAGKTVQVLIHGATSNHYFWDFPLDPNHYSYVDRAIESGYVTLNLDRLGIGDNDHPPGMLVDMYSNTYVIHQLVQALRAGALGSAHERFSKVVAVGISFGSATALFEAANYYDVDGIILVGFAHELNFAEVVKWMALFYPAYLDPKFASEGYPPDYRTTVPGGQAVFFNVAMTDPAVLARDEELKGTTTSGEFGPNGAFIALQPQYSLRTQVPVLIVEGTKDTGSCGPELPCELAADILARETQFWPPSACLEAFVLPQSGHVVNLHYDGPGYFGVANAWVGRRVGRDAAHPPSEPCR